MQTQHISNGDAWIHGSKSSFEVNPSFVVTGDNTRSLI